jgi:quinol monooxygenase YgiN
MRWMPAGAARRCLVWCSAAVVCAGAFGAMPARRDKPPKGSEKMYGLIGKITAVDGKRDELIAILLQGTRDMPGCLSYVVARDPADATTMWVTEVWVDKESHQGSLSLPAVQEAIRRGKPLIARFDQSTVTEPVGGVGLAPGKRR